MPIWINFIDIFKFNLTHLNSTLYFCKERRETELLTNSFSYPAGTQELRKLDLRAISVQSATEFVE